MNRYLVEALRRASEWRAEDVARRGLEEGRLAHIARVRTHLYTALKEAFEGVVLEHGFRMSVGKPQLMTATVFVHAERADGALDPFIEATLIYLRDDDPPKEIRFNVTTWSYMPGARGWYQFGNGTCRTLEQVMETATTHVSRHIDADQVQPQHFNFNARELAIIQLAVARLHCDVTEGRCDTPAKSKPVCTDELLSLRARVFGTT